MSYAPTGAPNAVCERGECPFAAIGHDHGHIYGMCNGLREAGAELAAVYDPDPKKVLAFTQAYSWRALRARSKSCWTTRPCA